ncbi:MAG: nitroreductase family protein [Symplocastrum torsivum CPER-KK1]|jgi:nitroreductase|uniref:Nitroreductase family protein n=1 Tax=Symplocastrum torsivum CPER-KK1 TaxID=450513 RepID=A0A951PK11_9CYAN|nr:nitroreductase family protein [Symplocastrum torsivum CPER-KK1]
MTTEMHSTLGLKESIEQRRAARAFRSDPIPEELLGEILRLGVRSPSGYNLQPWRFVVVREQENKEKLKACAFNQRQVGEAPVVLICCGDRRVGDSDYIESVIQMGMETGGVNEQFANVMREQIPALFEYHPCFENVEAWTNRHTMLAVAHIMIVAKSFGVDSCPMEGFVSAQVKEAFQIPEEVDVCCLLPLGYATEPFKQYGGRFEIDQVFFAESYGEYFEL